MKQNEFVFDTFEEANNVHKQLFKIGREKGHVTCADVLKLAIKDEESKEIIDSIETYHTHGWTNLWDVKVEPIENCVNGDWVLKMPNPKILKIRKGE